MRTFKAIATGILVGTILVAASLVVTGCGGGGGGGAAATIVGVVLDDTTLTPVSGATAQISGRTAVTNAQGAFTISGVPEGQRALSVYKQGYQTVQVQLTATAPTTNLGAVYVPVVATPGLGAIIGTVLDSGTPISNAIIAAGGKTAISKPDGTFAVYNLAPGNTVVTAQSGVKLGRANANVVQDSTATVSVGLTFSPPLPPAL